MATKSNTFFSQFSNKKKSGTIKEEHRKEKRKFRKEVQVKIDEKKMAKKTFLTNNPPIVKKNNYNKNNTAGVASIKNTVSPTSLFPLNKFIAHCGICGRREAAAIVKSGQITVNNTIITEPGFKVISTDKVYYKGKKIVIKEDFVYILLNKPKDYITTLHDTHSRKTVLELLQGATSHRVFPVGRLDRNTTGVLLFTNDGDLTQKLTHPSFEVKKIYEVTLDKPVAKRDLEAIATGLELEDGFIQADSIAYLDPNQKNVIGIEIHSGKNRIVRRIFEKLGYDVRYLDRVLFANLTKKNVDRGKWRFLTEKEVRSLKFLNKSFLRKSKETNE